MSQAKRRGKASREAFDFDRAHRQAMIGLRSRRGRVALDDVQAVHLAIRIASSREIADVADIAREACVQEIRIQGYDNVRIFQAILGFHRLAERQLRSFERVVTIHRLVRMNSRMAAAA